jgi:hypothetical protein
MSSLFFALISALFSGAAMMVLVDKHLRSEPVGGAVRYFFLMLIVTAANTYFAVHDLRLEGGEYVEPVKVQKQ